jgi:hypothetical protein
LAASSPFTFVVSPPASYDDNNGNGPSGYYQASFSLPTNLSSASLVLDVAGDDEGYAYLNGHNLGEFSEFGDFHFSTSDQSMFLANNNILTFAVSNSGGGPTGLSYEAVVTYPAASVPLPSALLLLGPGLVGLTAIRRRFKK